MVWRKRKTATEGSDKLRGTDSQATPAAGTHNLQTSVLGSQAPGTKELTPQNLDTVAGSWAGDGDEFKLSVRSQGLQRPYTIPRNYKIIGNITSARRVVIEGEFSGGQLESPLVTVTEGGCLRGRVKAENLQVAGMVDADVSAGIALEVSGRGQLAGKICSPQIKVWPGAILHGAVLAVGG